ncbi:MAG TPA: hypothetical protein VH088_16450 [Terriglobales bacterium]|jgi:hypothetical protein|nr:hypothetical protein [Terriglobales bacterium]
MTCTEFQEILPEVVEGVRNIDQESHLKTCSNCLDLVADLEVIFREARNLEGLYEPSPRVWNTIESTLRQEGIIRDAHSSPALVPPFRRRWASAWLMAPAGALALLAFTFFYQRQGHTDLVATQGTVEVMPRQNSEDGLMLQQASFSTPAVRQTYEASLRDVDAYIKDAEASAKQDPNDEEAQLSLMNAYQQRSMVYEMAMDRSLP